MQLSLRPSRPSGSATPSALADGWAERSPEDLAWSDQWERRSWSGRAASRLTWRDIRERSCLIAARLSRLSLGPGALVGICLPNGTDWMVAFLAVERAGLTPCCLPVDAAGPDLAAAIETAGLEAIVTQAAIGDLRPAQTICEIAARYYGLRYVLGFGPHLPDGVTDLDAETRRPGAAPGSLPHAGRSRGIVTFERSAGGWRPVLRSHPSLIAAAAPLVAAVRPGRPDTLVTLLAPDDLKAIVAGPMMSLLTGCAVEAQGLFRRADLDRSLLSNRNALLVAPGWMEGVLRRHLLACPRLILAHDAPSRLPGPDPDLDAVDLMALGESALLAAPRREGLAAALESAAGALGSASEPRNLLKSWLRLRIDPDDGRIHAGGLAAEVSRPASRSEIAGASPVRHPAEPDAPTSFGVERISDRVIAILSLA